MKDRSVSKKAWMKVLTSSGMLDNSDTNCSTAFKFLNLYRKKKVVKKKTEKALVNNSYCKRAWVK